MARRETPASRMRARMEHAEQLLDAIRCGHVDAFIVAGGRGPRVVMLEGAADPYIALMERINEGAVTLSPDGEILYANRFLAGFLGMTKKRLVGYPFQELVAPGDRATFHALLQDSSAGAGSGSGRGGFTMIAAGGARTQVLLSLSPLTPPEARLGNPRPRSAVVGIVTDLGAQKLAEKRLGAHARQQAAIAELGQRALAAIPLDALLAEAAHLVSTTLAAARCEVAELLPDGERLHIRAASASAPRTPGVVGSGPANPVLRLALYSGDPVVVDDFATDERFKDRSWLDKGVASAIAIAVPDEARPFGLLAASSPVPGRFSIDDTDFLQAVANVLSAAINRRRSEDLRRWLLEELTTSRDGERRRLSRELHDETRQSLWAIVVGLHGLETVGDVEKAREAAQRLHVIASRTLDDIGRLARGLHPGALDDHGLAAATSQFLRDFTSSYGIPVEAGVENIGAGRLTPEVEITLYRILQEALTNVARHAQAQSVRVTLRLARSAVELTVTDDGVGFRMEPVRSTARPGGLGLHGMRERALMVGGELTVASKPGTSTTVMARIPLQAAAQ